MHISVKDPILKTTLVHPFYVVGEGWVETKDLVVGAKLKLISGEEVEVEDWHTYYVSEYAILVHNKGSNPCAQVAEGVSKTPTYKLRNIWEEYTGKKAIGEVHHGLPEQFIDWFKSRNIDVNSGEFYFDLPKDVHRLKSGSGIHTTLSPLGEEWNNIWKKFISKNPNASKQQILNKLNQMAKDAGIEIYRAVKK